MKRLLRSTLIAVVMAASWHAPLVHAGLFDDDEARRAILDIRNRIDALQRDMVNKADKTSSLGLADQNDQLNQEIAKLRGQVEVLTNEVANAQQRQKDFYVDLDSRLRKLEPQQVTVDGKEASVGQNEQQSYDAALAQFKAGDYRGAGTAFADFITRYPQSAFQPSAQYWLGNAYYAQRDYRKAIATQQALIRNFPESPKAADALLNIASCYTELKDKAAAKKALDTLIAQYPSAAAAQTAKERLLALR